MMSTVADVVTGARPGTKLGYKNDGDMVLNVPICRGFTAFAHNAKEIQLSALKYQTTEVYSPLIILSRKRASLFALNAVSKSGAKSKVFWPFDLETLARDSHLRSTSVM
ncbi:hypothetical protein BASA62_003050 [Batrachochytrium salamandrivorans]|nr:hypothetical protein BASA62_003050 [Batrachochytrium salamandrivorans]